MCFLTKISLTFFSKLFSILIIIGLRLNILIIFSFKEDPFKIAFLISPSLITPVINLLSSETIKHFLPVLLNFFITSLILKVG